MKFTNVLIFVLSILTSGCGCSNIKKEGSDVSAVQKSDQPKLFVINVLDGAMHEDCHIQGSINVPFDQFNDWVKNNLDNKQINYDDHFVIYCSNYMCTASGFSAKVLTKLGFKNVWAYEAGLAEWHQKGFPVKGTCGKAYLKRTMDKPEHSDSEVKEITTEELNNKIKEMGLK